jgi:hypothetical protein
MKFAALLSGLLSVALLAGCDGDDAPAPPTASPAAMSSTTPTPAATPFPTLAPPSLTRTATETPTPEPTGGIADLVPDFAVVVSTPPPLGCTLEPSEIPTPILVVCVRNQGTASSGRFSVSATGTIEFGALAPGERACGSTSAPFAGVTVRVDVGAEVEESDETNNEMSYAVSRPTPPPSCTPTHTPPVTGDAPDLVMSSAQPVVTPPPLGCARDSSEFPTPMLLVCVHNQGTANAPAFTVEAGGSLSFGPLAAGEDECVATALPPFGELTIRIDPAGAVRESDEINNDAHIFVPAYTPPPLCTPTTTPSPTPTSVPAGVCYEAVECFTKPRFRTIRSQESCCDLALSLAGLPFSWCPGAAVDLETGDCSACVAHPCIGLPSRTPTETPTATPVPT